MERARKTAILQTTKAKIYPSQKCLFPTKEDYQINKLSGLEAYKKRESERSQDKSSSLHEKDKRKSVKKFRSY